MTHLTTHVLDAATGTPAAGVLIELRASRIPTGPGTPNGPGAPADPGIPTGPGTPAGPGIPTDPGTPTDPDLIAAGETDADGRLALGPELLAPGDYTLTFRTGEYLARTATPTFYPYASVAFTVTDAAHLHVPLLLSPFGYSTYRGS